MSQVKGEAFSSWTRQANEFSLRAPRKKASIDTLISAQISFRPLMYRTVREEAFFGGCGSFLKSLLNLLQYRFCFRFWFFGCETCGIIAPNQGSNLHPLHGKVKS